MRRHTTAGQGPLRWGCLLAAAGLAGLGLSGCALSWDDVTSRDFHAKDFFAKPPDPLVVLRDSKEGDKRAKAIGQLKEPKRNGGSDQDQDFMLTLLAAAATGAPGPNGEPGESRYYVRLEAVRKLGEFKDPRAVTVLMDAYYNANSLKDKDATVTPGMVSTFRCEAVRGLGNNGDPAAIKLLVDVLRQPPPDPRKEPVEAVRMVTDERIAAARALKGYPQYSSTEALLLVLKNDQDVALRDSAAESLQACTGKALPADYATWDDFLHRQAGPNKPPEEIAAKKKGFMELILTGFGGKP